MRRYAIVRRRGIDPAVVEQYLPSNYRLAYPDVIKCDWHKSGISGQWKQYPDLIDDVVVISGVDDHGWTLDKYVIPRLGSGGMCCDEIDLSHPIMQTIPA